MAFTACSIPQMVFKYSCGVCYDYALALATLYYAYYDTAGGYLPTTVLVVNLKDGGPTTRTYS